MQPKIASVDKPRLINANFRRPSFVDLSSPPGSPGTSSHRSARYVVPEVETSDEEPEEVQVILEKAIHKGETVPVGHSARSNPSVQAILNLDEGPGSGQHEGSQANPCKIDEGVPPQSAHAPENSKTIVNATIASKVPESSRHEDGKHLPGATNNAEFNAEKTGDESDVCRSSEGRSWNYPMQSLNQPEELSEPNDAGDDSSSEEDYNLIDYTSTFDPSDEEYESESASDRPNPNMRKSDQLQQPVAANSCESANNTAPSKRPHPPSPLLQSPCPSKRAPDIPVEMANLDSAWKVPSPIPTSTAKHCYSLYNQPHAFYPVHGLSGPWASARLPVPPPPPPQMSPNDLMISGTHDMGSEFVSRPAPLPFSCAAPVDNRKGHAQHFNDQAEADTTFSKGASAGPDLSRMSIPNIISGGGDKVSKANAVCGSKRKFDLISSDDKATKEISTRLPG